MIRLILVVVMLFSFTATAENLKYKRDAYANMTMHMKCYHIAKLAGLVESRADLHFTEYYRYVTLAWESITPEIKKGYSGESDFVVQHSKYTQGFIDGLYGVSTKSTITNGYMEICQEDALVFITTGK